MPGDKVPGNTVKFVEVHPLKVAVWLKLHDRVWVYNINDLVNDVLWFVGFSIEESHNCIAGPFSSEQAALSSKRMQQIDCDVFALPRSHYSERFRREGMGRVVAALPNSCTIGECQHDT